MHAHATALGNALGARMCRGGRRPSLYGVGRSAVRESRRKTITNRVDAGVDALERFAMMKSVETVSRNPLI